MKELIVHIGPPKTSTTATQMVFFESRKFLQEQGFHYQLNESEIANHKLAKFLIANSSEFIDQLTSDELAQVKAFPGLAETGRQLLSCEDFAFLKSSQKIGSIIRWARPSTLKVVVAFREPTKWIWSTYQQHLRNSINPNYSWQNFIDEVLTDDSFLLSSMLDPWLDSDLLEQVVLVDQVSNSAADTPFIIAKRLDIELDQNAVYKCRTQLFNESMGLGESMLTPMFNKEVVNELTFRQQYWGVIPIQFIKNVLLYQSGIAKSMFELGRGLEQRIIANCSPILDETSIPMLQEFSDIWWRDFDSTIKRFKSLGLLHDEIPPMKGVDIFKGFIYPMGVGFPISNYEDLIEIPAEFFSLVRLCASEIGLLWKAFCNQEQVNWLFDFN